MTVFSNYPTNDIKIFKKEWTESEKLQTLKTNKNVLNACF